MQGKRANHHVGFVDFGEGENDVGHVLTAVLAVHSNELRNVVEGSGSVLVLLAIFGIVDVRFEEQTAILLKRLRDVIATIRKRRLPITPLSLSAHTWFFSYVIISFSSVSLNNLR